MGNIDAMCADLDDILEHINNYFAQGFKLLKNTIP